MSQTKRKAQNAKCKTQNVSRWAGFTLMEMLVVVSVLGLIVVAISGIFLASVQSSSKAEVTKEVRYNGEYALSVMQGMILNSSKVTCQNDHQINVVDNAGYTTYLVCVESGQISSNSADLTANVSITGCNFTCTGGVSSPTKVNIHFIVSQSGAGSLKPGEKASLDFQTEVVTRNF